MTKIEEILEKLKQLSNEGKITWRPTVNRSTFSAVFGDSSALISKGGFIYTLRLLNESGNEIGRIDSDALTDDLNGDTAVMISLYESAQRQVLNVDAELDNVLVELNQL